MHYSLIRKAFFSVTQRIAYLIKARKVKHLVGLFTWEKRNKLVEELHAFVATLSLRTATLFQKP